MKNEETAFMVNTRKLLSGQYGKSLLVAASLYLADAVWLGQGIVAVFVIGFVVFLAVPRALWAWFRKEYDLRNLRLAKIALYTVTAIAIIGTIRLDIYLAEEKAEELVATLKQYQLRHGHYPDRLDALVPEFITFVPRARFSFALPSFAYIATPQSHNLSYVVMPPFGRKIYHMESGQWTEMD